MVMEEEGTGMRENRGVEAEICKAHAPVQWFERWVIGDCTCSSNPSLLGASALFNLTRLGSVFVCVCLCAIAIVHVHIWCKALHCAQSGRPVLGQ